MHIGPSAELLTCVRRMGGCEISCSHLDTCTPLICQLAGGYSLCAFMRYFVKLARNALVQGSLQRSLRWMHLTQVMRF